MNQSYNDIVDKSIQDIRAALLGDLYLFFYYMYTSVQGVKPQIPQPPGRENHFKTCFRAIQEVIEGKRGPVLMLNIAPRYGKTTMCVYAMAWCYAHNPRANNIYASFKKTLSSEKTEELRGILNSRAFKVFFDARISKSSSAKDNFLTEQGGRTIAVGADGSGLGSGAGTADKELYGGAIFIDDMTKAQDAHSAAMRDNVRRVYSQTLVNRRNDPETTKIICVGQRISQTDLPGMLLDGVEGSALDNYQEDWNRNKVALPCLDESNNALWPDKHNKQYLLDLKHNDRFTFFSQMQQEPISDSNRIFDVDRIILSSEEPNIIDTFIVCDTAETADRVNDASVFHMFGVYECMYKGSKTGEIGLHSISCYETRVEPQDLLEEFELFYTSCSRHRVRPSRVYIEKKSTGGMLLGFLRDRQGLMVIDILRNANDKIGSYATHGPKVERFKKAAPYVAKSLLSVTLGAEHQKMMLDHLNNITFSMTQKHDDIADTIADGISIALIDKMIYNNKAVSSSSSVSDKISSINRLRRS